MTKKQKNERIKDHANNVKFEFERLMKELKEVETDPGYMWEMRHGFEHMASWLESALEELPE